MPTTTPRQKVEQVRFFGEPFIETILIGDTFDDTYQEAMKVCEAEKREFIHPFDDHRTVAGQGTVGVEIVDNMDESPDFVFTSIGGGGLVSGIGSYMKCISPETKIIGVEPAG